MRPHFVLMIFVKTLSPNIVILRGTGGEDLTQIMKTGVRGRHNSPQEHLRVVLYQGLLSGMSQQCHLPLWLQPPALMRQKHPVYNLVLFCQRHPVLPTPMHSLPHLVMNTGSHDPFLKTVSSPMVLGPLCTRLRDESSQVGWGWTYVACPPEGVLRATSLFPRGSLITGTQLKCPALSPLRMSAFPNESTAPHPAASLTCPEGYELPMVGYT